MTTKEIAVVVTLPFTVVCFIAAIVVGFLVGDVINDNAKNQCVQNGGTARVVHGSFECLSGDGK